jgi:hypothetical protein
MLPCLPPLSWLLGCCSRLHWLMRCAVLLLRLG